MSRARLVLGRLERRWDSLLRSRWGDKVPAHFRIVAYVGHGSADQQGTGRVVVRGRVLDDPEPAETIDGETPWAAVRRSVAGFVTSELPGVHLRVEVGGAEAEAVTDDDGYFRVELSGCELSAPWSEGTIRLAAPYRGIREATARVLVRVSDERAELGVLSDVDDTILVTGVQRTWTMIRQTLTGSALTRTTFDGAPELYRALARPDDRNPFFYVSSSPWNLHDFLLGFLAHRGFPTGPVLLRDLVAGGHKRERIEEVLGLHPHLRFVLVGDSAEHDPQIYAETVRRHPGRILAVCIREVRLDPGDGRVEAVTDGWDQDVPFVLAPDTATMVAALRDLGLVPPSSVE
ncbi:App1 family protein [Nocardioides lianchengensis]|uniref:Phosphatidate phosphatase APP1 n=1 Tax=Nocardioides lianchengensis TaxID=1045774 RepID=A0A1G7AUN9_9ACTN|nr:phosphatase domain-containing protein [Nocardioides lianchengensis]NYG13305.1 phosphatidate phosphatase APP1 [Nocardioides lianchengensis]SDE18491.1 Phosphatidate phosphatase APP1 [Nocardioides lianchengensis]